MIPNYPKTDGVYGPSYTLATGLYVRMNQRGRWEVEYKKGDYRQKQSLGRGEEALAMAIKAGELLAAKLNLPLDRQVGPGAPRTFGDTAADWLELNVPRWAPTTRERYQTILRDFLPPLAPLPLTLVDRRQVKKLLADLLKIRAANTVEVVHAVISGIFSEAIDLGYTDTNPAHGLLKKILPPKNKRRLQTPDPFSRADLEAMLAAGWAKLRTPLPLLLETMAMSGLRLGEALAMAAPHLDLRNRHYRVMETTRLGHFGPPKTGERLIDLEEGLVDKLAIRIKTLQKEALTRGRPVHYLFPGISQRMAQRAMERACRLAGLRRRSPHDLRHTYATLLLMAHISPAYVQKQLGHHSISMTVDIYGHWIPGEGRENLEKTLRGEKAKPERPLKVVGK